MMELGLESKRIKKIMTMKKKDRSDSDKVLLMSARAKAEKEQTTLNDDKFAKDFFKGVKAMSH